MQVSNSIKLQKVKKKKNNKGGNKKDTNNIKNFKKETN